MSKGKTECPVPFPVSESLKEWARVHVPRLDLSYHTAEFEDYWTAHGKRMANWDATWRNWMRKAMDYKPRLVAPAPAYQAVNLPINSGVIDIAIQRMARAHGIDPSGKTESQIANEIWQAEQAARAKPR